MTARTYMLCEGCHRVIWVEDGPLCPDCRPAERDVEPEAEALDEGETEAE